MQHVVDTQHMTVRAGRSDLRDPSSQRVGEYPVDSVDKGRPGAEPLASSITTTMILVSAS